MTKYSNMYYLLQHNLEKKKFTNKNNGGKTFVPEPRLVIPQNIKKPNRNEFVKNKNKMLDGTICILLKPISRTLEGFTIGRLCVKK